MLREIKNMSSRAISPDQGENPIMADTEVKKIICSSCGAEFEDTLPKCPYCGSLNYKGAEAEYLGKLESMRQDMQQLEQVPEKELQMIFLTVVSAIQILISFHNLHTLDCRCKAAYCSQSLLIYNTKMTRAMQNHFLHTS